MATGLSDLGWDVDVGALFQTPAEVACAAMDSDVHVVGVSSQAAGHRTLVPQLIRKLDGLGMAHALVVVGGVVPPQDHAFLRGEGVAALYGPGTRIADAAIDMLERIDADQPDELGT